MNIRKFQRRTHLTQQQIADKMGMAKVTIAQYSTGKINPRFNDIAKWVDLGLTLDELFGEELASKMLANGGVKSSVESNIVPRPFDMLVANTVEKILREKMGL